MRRSSWLGTCLTTRKGSTESGGIPGIDSMDEIHGSVFTHSIYHYWVIVVNEYKRAWLSKQASDYTQRRGIAVARQSMQRKRTGNNKAMRSRLLEETVKQKSQKVLLGVVKEVSEVAAKSAMKGSVGAGIRFGGRVGLRVVPVVGAAMLAYDLYRLVDYLAE